MLGGKNPDNARDYLRKYYFSSYLDYLEEQRPENLIIDHNSFPDYFPNKSSFDKEIFDWIYLIQSK
ncbi:MAG: hypothetical protein A2653_02555 [Candidatus Zambryskibacteria bacterium RIFCSPHIGHO2_01_FULL_43_25]|uniref:Uncharacterized protein n=1 Tax=Candidatus Zambryskibacteria bacterium RIFCSPLOWO2_01_FULL_45_21 TaxID=1802761 RepID=A0A1G2U5J2_9BACT|nr:MAG: hypothetical protein A2653_02555 [Candidatus Zambryskibacteria bacterium RIFCSPHIGHO2_01_FULL_43_25]OHB00346.1 MAG: hypothetical protein A3E94_00950 [Candidatus Zambryskibacteria bacterium RIFCSPHIGHO2_12_FULL_44_12b]OHB04737.1 MAG: hypothetical protein A3B14_03705 [Candidatus Zambryskibacteria bacterium RIFCSPLOWO2_01_FULL_45_21]